MSGFLTPDTGSVRLDGDELVGLRPNAIVKRGVARTFQIVKPFRKLTVLENVVLAAFLPSPGVARRRPKRGESSTCSD